MLVAEYSGTARSGKGSIVGHLSEKYPHVACDETGADYRAVTKAMLLEGKLERGMAEGDVHRALAQVSFGALSAMAADRHELVAEHGLETLYQSDVSGWFRSSRRCRKCVVP